MKIRHNVRQRLLNDIDASYRIIKMTADILFIYLLESHYIEQNTQMGEKKKLKIKTKSFF